MPVLLLDLFGCVLSRAAQISNPSVEGRCEVQGGTCASKAQETAISPVSFSIFSFLWYFHPGAKASSKEVVQKEADAGICNRLQLLVACLRMQHKQEGLYVGHAGQPMNPLDDPPNVVDCKLGDLCDSSVILACQKMGAGSNWKLLCRNTNFRGSKRWPCGTHATSVHSSCAFHTQRISNQSDTHRICLQSIDPGNQFPLESSANQ
mmetsp:Transcript_51926/g.86534  ORF Transcript_51926/g.86534 Transcript_51926/m.86534 type:complete len:206 (-) Transcript_51926:415-1032(-)